MFHWYTFISRGKKFFVSSFYIENLHTTIRVLARNSSADLKKRFFIFLKIISVYIYTKEKMERTIRMRVFKQDIHLQSTAHPAHAWRFYNFTEFKYFPATSQVIVTIFFFIHTVSPSRIFASRRNEPNEISTFFLSHKFLPQIEIDLERRK